MNVSKKLNQPSFDWSNIESMGICLGNTLPPNFRPKSRIVPQELKVFIPSEFLHTIMVDGFEVTDSGINIIQKYSSILHRDWRPSMALNQMCLSAKIDTETQYFIPLADHFDKVKIQQIANWVHENEQKLLQIGAEFAMYEREIYHFLYEIVALFCAFRSISSNQSSEILREIRTATDLYHSRILAEIASGYSQKGASVSLHPPHGRRIPDLKIGNIQVDVKTILITEKNRKELMRKFAKKLRSDIVEKENKKQQIGNAGSFVIGVWSGVLNSIIYTAYQNQVISKYDKQVRLYDEIPPLNGKKAILVMPTLHAFQNNYLVFDRNRICNTIDYLANNGYSQIQEDEAMKYLTLTNIKKNCKFGITSDIPAISFKIR